MRYPGLRDKRVLVTAGAAGLGRAIAAAFLDQGARVHICDVSLPAIEKLAGDLPDIGATRADVSQPADVDALFEHAGARLGGLDVLVNNAGIAGPTGALETLDYESWSETLRVNLDGQFLCAKRAIPLLRAAGGGSIVNISSTAGQMGYPLRSPYVASKWAIIGLTKTLAMELGPSAIRVNAICPGALQGERMERVIAAEAAARETTPQRVREIYAETVSMRTFIDPAEVAAMIVFICSAAGAKVSGQTIGVDGHTETLRG